MRHVVTLRRGGKTGVVGLFAFDTVSENKLLPDGIDTAFVTQESKQALDRFQLGMDISWCPFRDRCWRSGELLLTRTRTGLAAQL